MADGKATENSELYNDPFSDISHPRFNDLPHPYDSTTSLSFPPDSLHDPYDEDELIEKQPLNVGQNFTGGFYPPA